MSRFALGIFLLLSLLCGPAFAQQEQTATPIGPYKLEPIDPTKNVIDLVRALKEALAELRVSDNKYRDDMRSAETRRINELAEQRERFDIERTRLLQNAAEASAKLLAEQLKEVKADLNARVTELEHFRWETGGSSSGANALWGYIIGAIGVGAVLANIALAISRRPTQIK